LTFDDQSPEAGLFKRLRLIVEITIYEPDQMAGIGGPKPQPSTATYSEFTAARREHDS
jgi:hypothetical protein